MPSLLDIRNESLARVRKLSFGDPVTNICAGENNPHRLAWFVALKTSSHTNRFGIVHRERLVECTDGQGRFWRTGIEVIHPGHLPYDECRRLFDPVHEALFGALGGGDGHAK